MAYTSHGHQIPGTPVEGERPNVARCGGIRMCRVCSQEFTSYGLATEVAGEEYKVNKFGDLALNAEQQLRDKCVNYAALALSGYTGAIITDRLVVELAEQIRGYILRGELG